jgi:hypothetical protein
VPSSTAWKAAGLVLSAAVRHWHRVKSYAVVGTWAACCLHPVAGVAKVQLYYNPYEADCYAVLHVLDCSIQLSGYSAQQGQELLCLALLLGSAGLCCAVCLHSQLSSSFTM